MSRAGQVAESGTCARPSGLQVQLALQPVFVCIHVLLHQVNLLANDRTLLNSDPLPTILNLRIQLLGLPPKP